MWSPSPRNTRRLSQTSENRARLSLESFDSRCAPSSLDGTGDPILIAPPLGPDIVNFTATAGPTGLWDFSGDVQDSTSSPAGLTVKLGGDPQSLQNVQVTTNANGHFDIIIQLNANGTDDGIATAQTTDSQGLVSNTAMVYVNP